MTQDTDGFLARWSRRKTQAREETPAPAAPPATPPDAASAVKPATPAAANAPPQDAPSRPLPSLQDVAQLTRDSDYTPFVGRQVDPTVRNAALRKLFTDPHFNVMDGLDVYIDDYGKPDPLPTGMLQHMVQSRGLGLFDEPKDVGDADRQTPSGDARQGNRQPESAQGSKGNGLARADDNPAAAPPAALTAESQTLPAERQPHEDPDLRLQPHHPAEVGRRDGDPDAGAATHVRGEPRGA